MSLKVTVYEHANFQGISKELLPGSYGIGGFGLPNDTLSSLKVDKGLKVTLYEHGDGTGRSKTFTSDAAWVGDDFNDITSNIKVELLKATVYEHANFQGISAELLPGSYGIGGFGLPNDTLSSLKVDKGLKVTLYEHGDGTGRSKTFTSDAAWVGDDFNDITSNIKVELLKATVYEHANFQGISAELLPGSYGIGGFGLPNDTLSSLKVDKGLKVTLYEHGDGTGRSKTFTSDAAWVGDDFNDITSNIKVELVREIPTEQLLSQKWVQVPNSGSVIGVTVLKDGTILGIGMDNYLWTRATLNSSWVQVPNSGSVIGVTVLQDGTILGIGMDKYLWTRATLNSSWVQVPNSGSVIGVTVLKDGTILGIGMDNYLWTRATLNSSWVQVPNSGSVIGVTVLQDGTILGIGMDKYLWTRATLNSSWVQVPNSGSVIGVTVLKDGTILGIGMDNYLWTKGI
jgi:hypothetical protein